MASIRRKSALSSAQYCTVQKHTPEWKLLSQFYAVKSGAITKQDHEEVHEEVNRIFYELSGHYSADSSGCATPQSVSDDENEDDGNEKSLKIWKDTVEKRKHLTKIIQKATGKSFHDVLINRSTVEDQEKDMVKRVLDQGDRLNPTNVLTRRWFKVEDLEETLPTSVKEQKPTIEVVGLPPVIKREQFDDTLPPDRKSAWLNSDLLAQNIEEKIRDITRVIEFYPDIDKLEVVGYGIFKKREVETKPEPVVNLKPNQAIGKRKCECKVRFAVIEEPPIIYGVKINEYQFIMGEQCEPEKIEVTKQFQCQPFECITTNVFCLENIGQKILNVCLVERNLLSEMLRQREGPKENEFILSSCRFRLLPGQKRNVFVIYQPRRVDIVRRQWVLKIFPNSFINTIGDIVLNLCGLCQPPQEYISKINGVFQQI